MADLNPEIIVTAKDQASRVLKGIGDEAQSVGQSFGQKFSAGLASAGLMAGGLVATLGLLGKTAVENAGKFEQSTVAFTTLLGDQAKAVQFLDQLKQDAARTPFELQGLVDMNQRLIGAGMAAEGARKIVLQLGDALSATGAGSAEMTRIGNTISQVFGKGKADAVDFKELVNAGWVSVKKDVADTLGVTMLQFEEMVSAGEVGFTDLSGVLTKLTSEGGKFHNAMINQSQTLNGRISTLKDNFNIMLADFAKSSGIFDIAKGAVEGLTKALEAIQPALMAMTQHKEIVVALAGAISGLLVVAIVALISAVGSALLVLGTFMAAGAAVALAVNALVEVFGGWDVVTQKVGQVFSALHTIFVTQILPALQQLWAAISSELLPALRELWTVLSPVLMPVLQLLGSVVGQFLVAQFKNFINAIVLTINIFTELVQTVARVVNFIKDAVQGMVSFISNLINNFKPRISIGLDLPDVAGAINDIRSRLSGAGRATGGMVPGPIGSPQLVLAHGGEEIKPFSTQKGGGGNGEGVAIHVHVGLFAGSQTEIRRVGEEIYRALVTLAGTQNKNVAEYFGG